MIKGKPEEPGKNTKPEVVLIILSLLFLVISATPFWIILTFEISPSGYGIHWPMIDEDLSIDGLLGVKHSVPSGKKVS